MLVEWNISDTTFATAESKETHADAHSPTLN
jgi:hypothetical protein